MAIRILLSALFVLLFGTATNSVCQNAEERFPPTRNESERCIKDESVCEQLQKLRIAHEKKEHGEMVSRAMEALRLSEELEASISANPQLSEADRSKLQAFEKLVRKIRSELGARDSDDEKDVNDRDNVEDELEPKGPVDVVSGFKILRESTVKFVDEIRKTTRFTISAAAIRSSNAVLKLTRALRFWR